MKFHVTHKGEGPSIRQAVYKALLLHEDLREASNSERLIAYVRAIPSLERVKSSTIDRTRRLVQLQHPDLRGQDWEDNHRYARRSVPKQIREDTWARTISERNLADWLGGPA